MMEEEKVKKKKIDELNALYNEADSASLDLFAEQRNNLLLVNGQHYSKRGSSFFNRISESKEVPREQKLRLVKNHVQKITKLYKNNITSYSPGVIVSPKNPSELSDVKAADLHSAVWEDIKTRHKFKRKVRQLVGDFVEIGEMILKVGFDYNAGRFLGYKEVKGEDGNWKVDAAGEPLSEPMFSGDHTFERIFGFNCLCDPAAQSFDESRFVIIRKMLPTKDVKALVTDPDKKRKIVDNVDERYKIYYGDSANTRDTKGLAMVREFYFRPCVEYPKGYFYITSSGVVIADDELPLGLFPVMYAGFDDAPTFPRAYSIIKQLRPYQAEINRTASKIAEHQITLGDDKLVMLGGSKIAHGGTAYGVKAINVTGSAPTVIPGRAGDQFVGYMQGQISEMYQAANLAEDSESKSDAVADPYARLFNSIRDKKKFSLYTDKVEAFLIDVADLTLRYAKEYYTDDTTVQAIGRKELVNIAEFKDADDLSVQIVLEPGSDDAESRIGKQLVLNHAIQFVGPQLDRSDLGHLLKNMPYGNSEGAFEELTMDTENATNELLALDRGKVPIIHPDENHDYVIRKLTNRMKKADFETLPPVVQQNYINNRMQRNQIVAQQKQQAAAATAGFVPTGGYLVGCDFFVEVGNGKAPKRARIPYEALDWLMKKLDQQGTTQKSLNDKSLTDQAGQGAATQPAVEAQVQAQPIGGGGMGMGAMSPPPGPPVN